jgi:Recombination endonuclease VII
MRSRYTPKPRPPRPEVPEGMAHCGRCDTVKPVAEFYSLKAKNWCKSCYRQWHRERYQPKHGATDEPRDCAWCGASYQPKSRQVSIYCSKAHQQAAYKASGAWRARYLQREYGISANDYDRMLAEQGGGCALCGIKPEDLTAGRYRKFLHVDHNHETGQVRGLLCPDHNLLLGRFGDSPEMFRRVAEYLEQGGSAPPSNIATADPP